MKSDALFHHKGHKDHKDSGSFAFFFVPFVLFVVTINTPASHIRGAVFPLCLHLFEILAPSLGNLLWTAEQAQSLNRRFHHVVRIV
jgi:hypothetical protein